MDKKLEMSYKEMAIDFLQLSATGKATTAFDKYVSPNFRHHNPYFKGDADSLMNAMIENAVKNPDKVLEVQRTLWDGEFVAVHSKVKQNPDDNGAALVHIFQFNQNKIIELWDIGQAVPKESQNECGMF
jgi:predicted SnoaL-like aldol condensation-catalyzing enzyme